MEIFFTKVLICFMVDVIFSFHGGGFFFSLEYNGAQIILIWNKIYYVINTS